MSRKLAPRRVEVVEGEIVEDDALAPVEVGELLSEALSGLSERSRKAYQGDWHRFGAWWGGRTAEDAVRDLVAMSAVQARRMVKRYREHMERDGLAPASVARAIRALNGVVKALHYVGMSPWVLGAKAPKVKHYKDVTGPSEAAWERLIAHVSRDTSIKGRRDTAILRALHDGVLRATEVCTLDLDHYDRDRPCLWILNKGDGERMRAPISTACVTAIDRWLAKRGRFTGPLFTRVTRGGRIPKERLRLNGQAVHRVVKLRGAEVGLDDLAPHKLRHSGITTAAKRWQGPMVGLQRFARHADPRTTTRYIDDVDDAEGQIAELVSHSASED